MKFFRFILFFIFCSVTILTAQNRVYSSIPINVSLVKGLGLNAIKSNLDFGEIVLNQNTSKISKSAKEGILFEVAGNPGKNITINFSPIMLTNSSWAENFGSPKSQIDFTPNVLVSTSQDLSVSQPITSGSVVNLSKETDGKLYVSIGGELSLNQTQPAGDYSGNFSLTIAY